ncbi:MAG: ATP-binding protein [Planctomycetes bacterium]|nr:ATP-binding protein [Planctomycetota bacterium]
MIPDAPSNQEELNALLQHGEGQSLEFKRSTSELREALRTLCAFLNGSGGIVLFGVSPDGPRWGNRCPTRPSGRSPRASTASSRPSTCR